MTRTFGRDSLALESTAGVLVREDVEPLSESIGGALGGRPRVAIRFGGVGSSTSASSSSRSTAFRFFGDEGPTAVAADVTDAETEGDLALWTRVSFEACDELERFRVCVGVGEDESAGDVDDEASAESLIAIDGTAEESIRGERSEAEIFRRTRVLVLFSNGVSSSIVVAFGTLLAGGFRLVAGRLVRLPAGATGLDVCSFNKCGLFGKRSKYCAAVMSTSSLVPELRVALRVSAATEPFSPTSVAYHRR